jgi:kanamycin nucleotidyltransferase
MEYGPTSMDHETRLAIANEIAGKMQKHFGEQLVALGMYGSVAAGTDGPFSDIEMECVLEGTHVEDSLEWSTGDWKAEIGISSVNLLLKRAAKVEGDWSKTHGCLANARPVVDPTHLFLHLRKTVISQPERKFRKALHELIVGDIFELVGKIRNAPILRNEGVMPQYTVHMAEYGACLVGLANRHLYSTGAKMLVESLTLDGRPAGYDELCQAVLTGSLADAAHCANLCEAFWKGVHVWASPYNLRLTESLDDLLSRLKIPD